MSSRSLDWDYEEKPIYSIPTLGQVHTGGVVKVYATFKMRETERERENILSRKYIIDCFLYGVSL